MSKTKKQETAGFVYDKSLKAYTKAYGILKQLGLSGLFAGSSVTLELEPLCDALLLNGGLIELCNTVLKVPSVTEDTELDTCVDILRGFFTSTVEKVKGARPDATTEETE